MAQDQDALSACENPQTIGDDAHSIVVDADLDSDRISLQAHDVSLCAVLTALAAEARLTIYGRIVDAQPISVQFERQRLSRVLDRLLGDGGYLLVFRDDASDSRGSIRALAPAGAQSTRLVTPSADETAIPAAASAADNLMSEPAVNAVRARREIIESAAELDDDTAANVLTSALADPDARVRELAVETLAMLETANARELLHVAMQDADAEVRLEVVDALGDLEDLRSTLALERALADTDPRVREAAAEYLAERAY